MAAAPPKDAAGFDALKHYRSEDLKDLGLRIWDAAAGIEHWLYPVEWYDAIPEGYPVLCISDEVEPFDRSKMIKESRYGVLPYGFQRATTP